MALLKRQLSYALVFVYLYMLSQQSNAEQAPLGNLYDNLLQREYATPISFPNHQVERKAQRSPSLRLRFGRSDPDMLDDNVEKRWFGDVKQKPIRSPSLRLRFGRRSDPQMAQLLERQMILNNEQEPQPMTDLDVYDYDVPYERIVRKPQRLRWGRSAAQQPESEPGMLLSLPQYEPSIVNENDSTEFQREQRRPLRLRWGRSTGKASAEPQPAAGSDAKSQN